MSEAPVPRPWPAHEGPRQDLPPWAPENVSSPGDTELDVIMKVRAARDAARRPGPRDA